MRNALSMPPALAPQPTLASSAKAAPASVQRWVQIGHGVWKKQEDMSSKDSVMREEHVELSVPRRTHTRIAEMLERQQRGLRAMQPDLSKALAQDELVTTARSRLRKPNEPR
jgi:ATP-dependent Clp protease ATP-binding subunit ClpA